MKRVLVFGICSALVSIPAFADDVYLKNGRVFEDVITEVGDDSVRIYLAFGEMSVALDSVESVEQSISSLEGYQIRYQALRDEPASSAGEWLELSRWARSNGNEHGARQAALEAAARNPQEPGLSEVMATLDFVFEPSLGRWISFEEGMRLRGYDKVDGEWLSADQRLARSQAAAEAARAREADEDRRLTRAFMALAAAKMAEPQQPAVVVTQPVGWWSNPFVWGHPGHRPRRHVRPDHPAAIPIEVRQPGSLFPIARHGGVTAGSVSSGLRVSASSGGQ
jgi:hypothetical protein